MFISTNETNAGKVSIIQNDSYNVNCFATAEDVSDTLKCRRVS